MNVKVVDSEQDVVKYLRERIRAGKFTGPTSGFCPGFLQGNMVIVGGDYADEFLTFCELNPKPCPVIGFTQPGSPKLPMLGAEIDIRSDIPGYLVFNDGVFSREVADITDLWCDDSVAIVMGCSFSFEEALIAAGYPIKNIDLGCNVSMYQTNIPTQATEHFHGNVVVSMRPFKQDQLEAVTDITGRFPKAHGAPIHFGNPLEIGIEDLAKPDYGDAVPLEADDIPVFWACGVTSQKVTRNAKLPLLITHAPGKMLVTDIPSDHTF